MADIRKKVDTKKSIWGFGANGWYIIFYCALMFWFYAGMNNDGTNITAPAISEKLGVEYPTVLSMGTIAGICAVVLWIIMGRVNIRLGVRVTSTICLAITGVAYMCMGNAVNLAMYLIAYICLGGAIMSAGYICGGVLVADWFPKKRGIVMGWTTMGLNCATAFFVPLLALLVNTRGVEFATIVLGSICIGVAILGLVTIKNSPLERNVYPDNVSKEEYETMYDTVDAVDDKSIWTVKQLLKTKAMWQCAVPTGLIQLITTGVVTQLVVRNVSFGMDQGQAILMMTVVALVGIVGSWLFGVLDQKIGTVKCMMIFGAWEAIALIANITETWAGIYISVVMIGMAIGGSANFMISLPANVFGRHGFSVVNSVLFPIQGLITCCAFAINAFALSMFGSLRYAFMIYVGVCVVYTIIVKFVPEFKYNRDINAEVKEQAIQSNQ
ncbi:MAG: MFS transporter [Clostridiales Family XIII bacterium]|jgi:OFA family oxalate/formate antiporter-like MFS transporter|nr:MFS transporter [Clostridiales Family XIII bacterium]